MANIISVVDATNYFTVQLGSLSFDVNRSNMKEGVTSTTATLSKKLMFKEDHFLNKI